MVLRLSFKQVNMRHGIKPQILRWTQNTAMFAMCIMLNCVVILAKSWLNIRQTLMVVVAAVAKATEYVRGTTRSALPWRQQRFHQRLHSNATRPTLRSPK